MLFRKINQNWEKIVCGTDLSRLVQYEIQMRVIEIFQGGLVKLSTSRVCDGYDEKVDSLSSAWRIFTCRYDKGSLLVRNSQSSVVVGG